MEYSKKTRMDWPEEDIWDKGKICREEKWVSPRAFNKIFSTKDRDYFAFAVYAIEGKTFIFIPDYNMFEVQAGYLSKEGTPYSKEDTLEYIRDSLLDGYAPDEALDSNVYWEYVTPDDTREENTLTEEGATKLERCITAITRDVCNFSYREFSM